MPSAAPVKETYRDSCGYRPGERENTRRRRGVTYSVPPNQHPVFNVTLFQDVVNIQLNLAMAYRLSELLQELEENDDLHDAVEVAFARSLSNPTPAGGRR